MLCEFCEEIRYLKDELWKIDSKFAVVLSEDAKGGGRILYRRYELNYCPVCGNKIKKSEEEE